MNRTWLGLLLGGLWMAGVPAWAHHSFAQAYSEEKSITIEGKVVDFDFRNPHSFLSLQLADDQGNMNTWVAEWRSSSRLIKEGFSKDSFRAGDEVVVTGSPGRNPAEHRIHLKNVRRASDGLKWDGAARK
jgi:hypothetical protein